MSLRVIWQYMDRSVTKKILYGPQCHELFAIYIISGPGCCFAFIFILMINLPVLHIYTGCIFAGGCYLLLLTLYDKICRWLAEGQWFFTGTPVTSTNKTDRHDITEILLKVELNTISLTFNIVDWLGLSLYL